MKSKEVLGTTPCEGCSGEAVIKQRNNGKKLLYLHCTSCGLDQRTGGILQAKWQRAINGEQEPVVEEPINEPEKAPVETQNNEEEPEPEKSSAGWGLFAGVLACVGLALGLKAR
ncbi:hypothetical protein [Thalassotalea sp. ND16A]|uniref:hypothetical protein n=1 Tax=Thalassotalea sp. ND16A TaxID=1535422 RepID=UPI00051A82E9|nr:hypothetical protein [Thalassotalea sp. ND16A]KGJ98130.1 hypothetical protein ND16A_0935 [Thalassotalea sp. ND16A]